jgi:hypothetical protein
MIDVDSDLGNVLRDVGSTLSAAQVRSALAATNKEIREDRIAHGCTAEEPFWDMLSDESAHVFSVFGTTTLDLFAFSSSDFHALINSLNSLAMADVNELKELLAKTYGVSVPQLSMSRSQAEHWLGG